MNNETKQKLEQSARQEAADFARAEREARRGADRAAGKAAPAKPRAAEQSRQRAAAAKAQPPRNPHAKKRSGGRRAALIAGVVVAVLCVALLVGALITAQRDTIFPNVTFNGTDLAGMTQAEAEETIRETGFADADATVLTVTLPGSVTLDVTAGDTGFTATAEETAQAAWNYGRDGNLITNFFTYLRAAFSGRELADELSDGVDEAALRSKVEAAAAASNDAISEANMGVDEEASELRLIKGAARLAVDADTLYALVTDSLRAHTREAAYDIGAEDDTEIDMQELHDSVCGDPVNARYDSETKQIVEGKPGVEFDVDEAQRLWDRAELGELVRIPVTLTQPDFLAADVTELFHDKLSGKTTSLSGSSGNRITNVTLAAQHIDGVILEPGDTFSYNQTVGQRTTANGFKEAGAYANGKVVQEVGGGICQVSSTLYYCTLVANLKIVSRTNHYFTVGYIEPGMDATVSWGAPDFQFQNDRTFPIKIHAYVSGGSLTVEIWGTDVDGSYVKMDYTVSGLTATTYRGVYAADGTCISRTQEATSVYHSHDTTPSPTSTPTPVSTPTAETPTPETPTPETPTPETPAEPATPEAPAPDGTGETGTE